MKKFLVLLCIVCMMLSLFSCQAKDVNLDVVLNEEKSYFSDFKIENDKVYIYCTAHREIGRGYCEITIFGYA